MLRHFLVLPTPVLPVDARQGRGPRKHGPRPFFDRPEVFRVGAQERNGF